jgi:outer membrane protein assembly factor BamB
VLFLSAISSFGAEEPSWPSFRGPNHDGISTESNWNPAALAAGPKILWQVNVGKGWSSVAVSGQRLYTMGNVGDQDIVYCLDPATGKELWRHSYPCKAGDWPGPRATPTLDGADVFTMSRDCLVLCLDAEKGTVKWSVDVAAEFKTKAPQWSYCGSLRVDGDLLLVNAGDSGVALDKKTGKAVWGSAGIGGYAVPVPFGEGAKRQVAIFGCKALVCVAEDTGKVAWSFPWVTGCDVNAPDPLITPAGMFIASGYGKGCAMLDISGPEPKALWQNKLLCPHFSSAVFLNGFIFGIDGNTGKPSALRCLDPKTGEEKWSEKLGFGSMMAADGKLIFLNEAGGLTIVPADPAGCKKLAEGKVSGKGKFWTPPVLCAGRIYCRSSEGDLSCVDVGK